MEIGSQGKGYRNRLQIIRDILLVVIDAGDSGSRKTHIMYGANLSYKLLSKYMDEVIATGLITEYEKKYFLTKKGVQFLEIYKEYEEEYKETKKHNTKLNNGIKSLKEMLDE